MEGRGEEKKRGKTLYLASHLLYFYVRLLGLTLVALYASRFSGEMRERGIKRNGKLSIKSVDVGLGKEICFRLSL